MIRTNWWAEAAEVVALVMSAAYSGQFQAAQESVVEAEVGQAQLVASHPSVVVASHRGILEAAPCQAVAAASVPVDPAATAVCPSRVEESV